MEEKNELTGTEASMYLGLSYPVFRNRCKKIWKDLPFRQLWPGGPKLYRKQDLDVLNELH